jgi:hypothetical protein
MRCDRYGPIPPVWYVGDEDDPEGDGEFVCCPRYLAEQGLLCADNILARCCKCEVRLQLPPDVPKELKRICLECVRIEANISSDEE